MTEHYTEANCRKLALEHGALLIKLSPIAGLAGIPDRLLLWWGCVVFIEFKAQKRYLKPRQKWWRDWLTKHGFRVHLFRTTEEFRALLDSLPKPCQTPSESINHRSNGHADVATAPVPTPSDGTGGHTPRRRVRDLR